MKRYRRTSNVLCFLLITFYVIFFLSICFGQESRRAHITFEVPKTRIDGKTLVGPVTIRLYAGKSGAGKTVVASGFKSGDLVEVTGGLCFEAAAVDENGIEGLHTKEKCLPAQPRAPTQFQVTEAVELAPQ